MDVLAVRLVLCVWTIYKQIVVHVLGFAQNQINVPNKLLIYLIGIDILRYLLQYPSYETCAQ